MMASSQCAATVAALAFVVCFGLFLVHSYREVGKFFSGWTAKAFHTDADSLLIYPVIVVCHKNGK